MKYGNRQFKYITTEGKNATELVPVKYILQCQNRKLVASITRRLCTNGLSAIKREGGRLCKVHLVFRKTDKTYHGDGPDIDIF